jgi:hypothetical protein
MNVTQKLAALLGPKKSTAPLKPYSVLVADNFHYMDESEIYTKGSYATLEMALVICKQIVLESLIHLAKPGMSGDEVYKQYVMFGDDPFIIGPREGVLFSAWSYAKQVCDRHNAPKSPPPIDKRGGNWGQGLVDNLNRNVLANVPTT